MHAKRGLVAIAVCSVFTLSAHLNADGTVAPGDPCGCWCGEWCSYTNGHHGAIKARVCQVDACTYCVHYSGRFLGILPFAYSAPMTVTGTTPDGKTLLYSQSNSPILGQFTANAEVTACNFTACYSSCKDQGQFVMTRQ